jgi:FkbM family methyltransferase
MTGPHDHGRAVARVRHDRSIDAPSLRLCYSTCIVDFGELSACGSSTNGTIAHDRLGEMSVAMRVTAAAKSTIRRGLRGMGYEIARFATSFATLQAELLAGSRLVVDVGANTGQYAKFVRSLGYAGPVVSFEPQVAAYEILRRRTASDQSWTARRVALGASTGEATLQISRNSVSSSLLEIREEHVRAAPESVTVGTEQVPLSTLDIQLADDPTDDLWLKLDVQGAELAVLEGGSGTLCRTRVVQSELSLSPLYEGQTDHLMLSGFLRDRGFRMVHVQPGFQDPGSHLLLQMDALFVHARILG